MPVAPDLSGCALDDRYELQSVLGEGAFGRVYRGVDRRLARPVAVKVIKPWWAEDPEWVEAFEREAQLLARVSSPGIVQIYDVGQAEEGLYYVSELVEGESLQRRLKRGALPPREAATLAEQLCRGLAEAHAQRIIHRDIKPANILITVDGRVKVGDFGVARLAEGSTDGALATIVGTPRYMAPEQGHGRQTTPATDVYSAGVVLYEMLAGRPPFTGASVAELALSHLQEEPPPLPDGAPKALRAIVARALQKDPTKRYSDAAGMADALAAAERELNRDPRGAVRAARRPSRAAAPARTAPASANGSLWAEGGTASEAKTRPVPLALERTVKAPRRAPTRRWNPAARRRTVALFVLVAVLAGAMVIVGLALHHTAPRTVRVPRVRGLTKTELATKARRAHLSVRYARPRYSLAVPAGDVVSVEPRAGQSVDRGTALTVTLSRGPAPVDVPRLTGYDLSDATSSLKAAGLHVNTQYGSYPSLSPGKVYATDPVGGKSVAYGSTVTLVVAETPKWQATGVSFQASGSTRTDPFRIRGSQFRIDYAMSFSGYCSVILLDNFCSAPIVSVVSEPSGQVVTKFQMNEANDQSQVVKAGPGSFALEIDGSDHAQYSVSVDDDF